MTSTPTDRRTYRPLREGPAEAYLDVRYDLQFCTRQEGGYAADRNRNRIPRLTHAVCMADLGHEVLAIDVDRDKIVKAARREVPFFEPGLEALLRKNLDARRLHFTTSYKEVARFGNVHFICVGTPEAADGTANPSYLFDAADALAQYLLSGCLVVGKSTVPVGTARTVMAKIRAVAPAGNQVDLAWNPEFLREGFAVQDTLRPDCFVFGVASAWARKQLTQVYNQPLAAGIPRLAMDLETAELVKVSANAFLATLSG